MIAYTSRTGTLSTLAALRELGWRQLVAPGQRPSFGHTAGWMLDNGAWSLHRNGRSFDARAGARFLRHLVAWGRHADFVVAPDIVAGGAGSLALSRAWLPACMYNSRRTLVAVQDGMTEADLAALPLGPRVGLFVGGSTEWKLATVGRWGAYARRRGCWLHVGRVNSADRIDLCRASGADSFDGKSPVMFPSTLPLLDGANRQRGLFTRAHP